MALLQKPLADTVLIDAYNELAWPVYSYDSPDSSIYYGNKALALAEKIKDIRRQSIAQRRIGITYLNKGDFKTSIAHEEESYALSEKINFRKGMQRALNNIGVAYLNNELFSKALGYFLKCLSLVDDSKDYSFISQVYTNCGTIYRSLDDKAKSKEFFLKAHQFAKLQNDSNLLILSNCNISSSYRHLGKLDSARAYMEEASHYLTAQTPGSTKYNYLLNQALLPAFSGDHASALKAFLNCLPFVTSANDEITLYINIGDEYKKLNELPKALNYYKMAYAISEKNKMYNNLEYLSFAIAHIYESKKDWSQYSNMMKEHLTYRDSNAHINAVQQILRQQLEFDFERKQVADSIKFLHLEELKNAELAVAKEKLSSEKAYGIMLVGILAVIILFSLFISNRFVLIRRQKKIIEQQKHMVEVKNQEMLDSINYARRLQTAILPEIDDIKAEINFDILYLPKDIIGGDFYFFENHNGLLFVAVCDCTGHGIPGAIMSVVCHQALQKAIKEFNLSDPGEILSRARELIIESLNAALHNIKDGMDCSLLVIEKSTGVVQWAGANNPLWIVTPESELVKLRAGLSAGTEHVLTEMKADKQPVAFYENLHPFTGNKISTKPGSVFYLISDGYASQFGGVAGKKFKNKALKNLFLTMANEPVEKQAELLRLHFFKWKDKLDQVDDVTVGIVRI